MSDSDEECGDKLNGIGMVKERGNVPEEQACSS